MNKTGEGDMKLSTLWIAAAVAMLVTIFGSGFVYAQDAAAVDKRQATMKRMGGDLKAIREYGTGQGDQDKAVAAAKDVDATQKSLVDLFPKGTGSDAFPGKSYANPKIWTDWDKFVDDNKIVQDKAGALLAKMQAGDKDVAASGASDLWDNGCQVCHKSFREKKSS
jgi:cytochrome c556